MGTDPKKKKNKKSSRKRRPWGMIALAVVIIVLLLLMTINPNTFNKKERPKARNAEPAFTKEGELELFSAPDSTFVARLDIEIADNNYERARGMMYRKSVDEKTGMLFIMPREELQSFWMRNTYVSLDILYLDSKFRI